MLSYAIRSQWIDVGPHILIITLYHGENNTPKTILKPNESDYFQLLFKLLKYSFLYSHVARLLKLVFGVKRNNYLKFSALILLVQDLHLAPDVGCFIFYCVII